MQPREDIVLRRHGIPAGVQSQVACKGRSPLYSRSSCLYDAYVAMLLSMRCRSELVIWCMLASARAPLEMGTPLTQLSHVSTRTGSI